MISSIEPFGRCRSFACGRSKPSYNQNESTKAASGGLGVYLRWSIGRVKSELSLAITYHPLKEEDVVFNSSCSRTRSVGGSIAEISSRCALRKDMKWARPHAKAAVKSRSLANAWSSSQKPL